MLSYRVVRVLGCVLFLGLFASIATAQDFGTLAIQARPEGAEIRIDGERWTGSGDASTLQVQLTAGVHRVEVRAPGRLPYLSDVTIRAGQTTPLNVSLSMAPAPPRSGLGAAPVTCRSAAARQRGGSVECRRRRRVRARRQVHRGQS